MQLPSSLLEMLPRTDWTQEHEGACLTYAWTGTGSLVHLESCALCACALRHACMSQHA